MFFKRLGTFFLDIIEVVVFSVAIFLFMYLLVMQPHKIKGDSMQPNYPDGEYLLTDKVTYRFRDPKRGEVVVFEAPGTNGDEFIKRIIGLPGEKIKISEDKVYINGKRLEECYLQNTLPTPPGNYLMEDQEREIPEGQFAVLGDNRPSSSDSRSWGFVSKNKITGKAWVIYWPVSSFGVVKNVSYAF